MSGRLLSLLLVLALGSPYVLPVTRAYRCVGDPPKLATSHGCCPEDDVDATRIGRPCCQRLPHVALPPASTSSTDTTLAPARWSVRTVVALARVPSSVRLPHARRGLGPPHRDPKPLGTVLRV